MVLLKTQWTRFSKEKAFFESIIYLSGGLPVQIEEISKLVFGSCSRLVNFITQDKHRASAELFVG